MGSVADPLLWAVSLDPLLWADAHSPLLWACRSTRCYGRAHAIAMSVPLIVNNRRTCPLLWAHRCYGHVDER